MRPEEASGATPEMNRRRFLRLSAVGIAGASLLGVVDSGGVLAQEPSPGASSLVEEFEQAAAEYGVPKGLLMAMGYVNARWEMPPVGPASTSLAASTAGAATGSCTSSATLPRTPWARRRG